MISFFRSSRSIALSSLLTTAIVFTPLAHVFVQSTEAASRPYYEMSMEGKMMSDAQTSFLLVDPTSSDGQFGANVIKADLNGDGYDDLITAAPYFGSDNRVKRGRVSVLFGGKDFSSRFSSYTPSFDIEILGSKSQSQLGTSLASGDFNGDGLTDLILGAPGDESVYVLFGKKSSEWSSRIDLAFSAADWTFQDNYVPNERFGFAVDSADINNDGIDDLIVGAPFASHGDRARVGRAYVFYGKKNIYHGLFQNMNYRSSDFSAAGNKEDDRFGITLAHGDIDGDRKVDLAIGSYMASHEGVKQAGTVTLLLGARTFQQGELLPESVSFSDYADKTLLSSDRSFDWFGYALAFGDLNGDQLDDLVVTSFPFLKQKKQGTVYIVWGKKSGDFAHARISRVIAPDGSSLLGASVALADVNHDGNVDLILGAPTGAPGSDSKSGRVYILSFFPRNALEWNFSKIPPDMTITGRSDQDWFGNVVVAGDFDNDGNRDLVVGVPNSMLRLTKATSTPSENAAIESHYGSLEYLSGPLFPRGEVSYTLPAPSEFVSRGSFIVQVIKRLNLEGNNRSFIDGCLADREACFFQFLARTRFSNASLQPNLLLYPDVAPDDPYYHAVTVATILGMVQGFSDEQDGPFHPERPMSRIHALKILLTAANLLPWKDFADLRGELQKSEPLHPGFPAVTTGDVIARQKTPYQDISTLIAHMWWYPRYVNFAYLDGIIDDQIFFRPDEPLAQKDFSLWLSRIVDLARKDKEKDKGEQAVSAPTAPSATAPGAP